MAGLLVRRQRAIHGVIELKAERLLDRLFKVAVSIENLTEGENADGENREEWLMGSLMLTHTLLGIHEGEFISLLDPPDSLSEAAKSCHNVGTYPVLAAEQCERCMLLSSPIILYDYPEIARESAGDLFDSTEIDEILTLRILTLSEAEKKEMRNLDERARRILERTESLPPEQMMKLHGTMCGRERSQSSG